MPKLEEIPKRKKTKNSVIYKHDNDFFSLKTEPKISTNWRLQTSTMLFA
jgi:hypothetical protein